MTGRTSRSVSDNADPNTLADPRIRPRPGARWVCPPCRRTIAAAGSGPEAESGHPRDWRCPVRQPLTPPCSRSPEAMITFDRNTHVVRSTAADELIRGCK